MSSASGEITLQVPQQRRWHVTEDAGEGRLITSLGPQGATLNSAPITGPVSAGPDPRRSQTAAP